MKISPVNVNTDYYKRVNPNNNMSLRHILSKDTVSFKSKEVSLPVGRVVDLKNESIDTDKYAYLVKCEDSKIIAYTIDEAKKINLFNGKNPKQILSFATEHNNIDMGNGALKKYQAGGLGCVAKELAMAAKKAGVDIRTVLPYHGDLIDEADYGKLLVVRLPKDKRPEAGKEYNGRIQPDWVHKVDADYVPTKNEFFVVLNHVQNENKQTKEKEGFTYVRVVDTGIKGEVEGLKDGLWEKEKIPYRVFKQATVKDVGETEDIYYIHTAQTAAMKKAYGENGAYKPGFKIGKFYDLYLANTSRALVDAFSQFKEKEDFNPANILLHDRQTFPVLFDIIRRSADGDKNCNGIKVHSILHNPGYDYQGHIDRIQDFMKIMYDEKDFKALEERPDYQEFKNLVKKPPEEMTENELKFLNDFFKPYFNLLLDDYGMTNMTKMVIAAAKVNPKNSTFGTVSRNYGEEMVKYSGIAEGLTSQFKEVLGNIINVTNGSLPASLKLDKRSDFAAGGNALSAMQLEYNPYSPLLDSNNKVINFDKSILELLENPDENEDVKSLRKYSEGTFKAIADLFKKDSNDTIYNTYIRPIITTLSENAENPFKNIQNFYEEESSSTKKLSDEKYIAALRADLQDIDSTKSFNNFRNALFNTVKDLRDKKPGDKSPEKALLNKLNPLLDKVDVLATSVKDGCRINKEWFAQKILDCNGKDEKETKKNLNDLFLNSDQMKGGQSVYGSFKEFNPQDRFYTNWGRPDFQKGFPTFLQGYLEFLKSDAPENDKKHAKLVFGTGGAFKKEEDGSENKEKTLLKKYLKEIQEYDGGKYKNNVIMIEGAFPNKLISACDYGLFTSRFEPCGITPFECFAAGRPVASIRTGGAPNFVFDKDNEKGYAQTGFLTKDPFMMEAEDLDKVTRKDGSKLFDSKAIREDILDGLEDKPENWTGEMRKIYTEKLDTARREYISGQIADLFKRTMAVSNAEYNNVAKTCCEQQIEWDKNSLYNGGEKSAIQIYMEDIFGIYSQEKDKDGKNVLIFKEHNKEPLKKLTGSFPENPDYSLVSKKESFESLLTRIRHNSDKVIAFGSKMTDKMMHFAGSKISNNNENKFNRTV